MRRGLGFLILVGITMVITLGAPRAVEGIAGLELFQVDHIEVEGERYLSIEEIVAAAAIPEKAGIWDEKDPIVERLEAHPAILDARVKRRIPAKLILEVVEREPVALLPDPVLVPVDVEGRVLPIDPSVHRLDLPLIHPVREGSRTGEVPLTPQQVRTLAAELVRVGEFDPDLLATVSEVSMDAFGDLTLHLGEPRVDLLYRPPLAAQALRDGLTVLADAVRRNPNRTVTAVDLRFAEQVVVRLSRPNRR